MRSLVSLALVVLLTAAAGGEETKWQIAKGPLATRWAKDVSPENVLPEYPRPQMVRKEWTNLNGLWQYAVRPKDASRKPEKWDGRDSRAVRDRVGAVGRDEDGEARRAAVVSPDVRAARDCRRMERLLLHFGAVDWEATV